MKTNNKLSIVKRFLVRFIFFVLPTLIIADSLGANYEDIPKIGETTISSKSNILSLNCGSNVIKFTKKNSKITLAATKKVSSNKTLKKTINNAASILKQMTGNLSTQAKTAINKTTVVVYKCDPTGDSGQGILDKKPDSYDLNNYDYITLLAPLNKCEWFQKNPGASGGRSWDNTYGVGVPAGSIINGKCKTSYTDTCDTTTICAYNLYKNNSDGYHGENILVHEFGHTIMNAGLLNGNETEKANYYKIISNIYSVYRQSKNCNKKKDVYSCSNAEEMWAEATQGWFGATTRTDVNPGLTSPEVIRQTSPQLYKVLKSTYGAPPDHGNIIPPYNS